jgi:hypothetical protein
VLADLAGGMTRYAERTKVPVTQSRAEIERVLERYGADAFGYGWDDTRAVVSFRAQSRYVRFAIEIPSSPQEERQRWRALLLVIKAKLEAVESGVTTFEEEFLAYVVLPDNQTVGDWLLPQVELAYENGGMPKLLMPGTA